MFRLPRPFVVGRPGGFWLQELHAFESKAAGLFLEVFSSRAEPLPRLAFFDFFFGLIEGGLLRLRFLVLRSPALCYALGRNEGEKLTNYMQYVNNEYAKQKKTYIKGFGSSKSLLYSAKRSSSCRRSSSVILPKSLSPGKPY